MGANFAYVSIYIVEICFGIENLNFPFWIEVAVKRLGRPTYFYCGRKAEQ